MAIKKLKSKIVLLGDVAVGKTSLIRRYVLDEFDDKYITTIGTKVTKKKMVHRLFDSPDSIEQDIMIYDLIGQSGYAELHKRTFQGAEGALVVCDVTRNSTLYNLYSWQDLLFSVVDEVPIIFLGNKSDLTNQAEFGEKQLSIAASKKHMNYMMTSAKTGRGVEEAFNKIALEIVKKHWW